MSRILLTRRRWTDNTSPLQIKVDIRDQFNAPTCAVKKAFGTLEDIIGLKISCNIEWDLLWNALEASFPDKTIFVPNVAGVLEAWCNVLSTRLEDDKFEAWTEDLINKIESTGAVKLIVQVRWALPGTTFARSGLPEAGI